jgi:hypothetical protein
MNGEGMRNGMEESFDRLEMIVNNAMTKGESIRRTARSPAADFRLI